MREMAKMASQSFCMATSGASSGKMAVAHGGVAAATMVQLISWRVISSSAGRYALETAWLARPTFAGSSLDSNPGLAPDMANRAQPLLKAAPMPS